MKRTDTHKIQIVTTGPDCWTTQIAAHFNLEIKHNQVELPDYLGQGTVRYAEISPGLHTTLMDLYLKKAIEVFKTGTNTPGEKEFYPIIFNYSESGVLQEVNGEYRVLGRNTPNSITIPSPGIEARIYLPSEVRITTLAVVLSKNWINEYLYQSLGWQSDKITFLRHLFFSRRNYFIYEVITLQMAQIIQDILQNTFPPALSRMYFQAKFLELLAHLFDKLLQREFGNGHESLHSEDVEALFSIKKIITEQMDNPPTIAALSRQIGMSESKLKKIFKQVFGYSIYQYILLNRMQKAKFLLDTKRYNVSEVGTELGYSNLAHFAKAFKKQYHISPSNYLSSLKG